MMSKLLRLGQDVPPIHTSLDHCVSIEEPVEDPVEEPTEPEGEDVDPADTSDVEEPIDDETPNPNDSSDTETQETEDSDNEAAIPNTPETETPQDSGGCHAAPGPLYLLPLIVGLLRRRK